MPFHLLGKQDDRLIRCLQVQCGIARCQEKMGLIRDQREEWRESLRIHRHKTLYGRYHMVEDDQKMKSDQPSVHPVSDHSSRTTLPSHEWCEREVFKWEDMARQYGDTVSWLRELMALPGGRWRERYGPNG